MNPSPGNIATASSPTPSSPPARRAKAASRPSATSSTIPNTPPRPASTCTARRATMSKASPRRPAPAPSSSSSPPASAHPPAIPLRLSSRSPPTPRSPSAWPTSSTSTPGGIVTGETTIPACAEKLLESVHPGGQRRALHQGRAARPERLHPLEARRLALEQFRDSRHYSVPATIVVTSETSERRRLYSSIDATTANAAIAAVSARRIRGPSETARHPFASNSASSSGAHPPSGPIAISSAGISAPPRSIASSRAVRSVVERSCSASTMRVALDAALARAQPAKPDRESPAHPIAATAAPPHAQCAATVRRASLRPAPDASRVRRAITGAIAATPSSVAFSMAHSMRSNL